MSLLITIIKAPDSVANVEPSMTFDAQGGSIGRGKDNTWTLQDPERFLSSCHCKISCENGQFYITDVSTNGTFYNGLPHPIGKGSKLPINDGDTFALGDYEFSISLTSATPFADPFEGAGIAAAPPIPDDIFSAAPESHGGLGQDDYAASPFAGGHASPSESLFSTSQEETDPLAALDKAQGNAGEVPLVPGGPGGGDSSADLFDSPTHSDQAGPLNQQVTWPEAIPETLPPGGGIPDDWDDDLLSPASPAPLPGSAPSTPPPVAAEPAQDVPQAPSAAATSAANQAPRPGGGQPDTAQNRALAAQNESLKKANELLQSELKALKQQLASQQQRGASGDAAVDTTLVDALGFQTQNLDDAQITQINELVGEVVREMVIGLMQVLGSRSSIKNEFRMNVTTIQPVENNPLKFSANIDDALENMFIKKGNAYKKPVEAVREGFEGIAEHQVAIVAGIRAAFKGLIERFDPVLLDARFSRQNKGGLVLGSQKAKNWEQYLDYYNELVGDIYNTFQFLFGDDFVRAYEDQLQKLAIDKKSNKPKDLE